MSDNQAARVRETYLQNVQACIEQGRYKDRWDSLSEYPQPAWYKEAKFGIFIHWGVYSVPAFGSEWYPRHMYIQGTAEFEHHLKHYGHPRDFGYADFIPLFTAENFDAAEWIQLFKAAGAKYVMPVAEHHDGFQMYASELSGWNAAVMGPKRDIIGELKAAAEKENLVFTVSSHRAENFWFYGGGRTFDSGIRDIAYQEPYGYAAPLYPTIDIHPSHDIYSDPPSKEHLEDWLVRCCELIDKYQPKIVWFDWWIHNVSFKPYLRKFAAYYYNRSLDWGTEVAINYKYDAFAYGTAVFDIERGQQSAIKPELWQSDTAISKNSWGYTTGNDFKKASDIVCDLIDIVSKNGCLLLNIGPKSDGTITDEETAVLRGIGEWLRTNGEAIYGTTAWNLFGEGPTKVAEGAFTDVHREPYKSGDIRFTYKAPWIYAHVLNWSESGEVVIESLRKGGKQFEGHIAAVEVLGFDGPVSFQREESGLKITVPGNLSSELPVVLKITID